MWNRLQYRITDSSRLERANEEGILFEEGIEGGGCGDMSNSHPSLSILNLGLIPTKIACLTSKFWSANITSHLHIRRFRFPSGNGKLPLAMAATDRIPKGHFHLLYVAVPFMLLADPCQVHTLPQSTSLRSVDSPMELGCSATPGVVH